MIVLRRVLMGLSILHLLITMATAAIGLFADGGAVYSRLVVSAVHPLTALAVLLLAFAPRLSTRFVVAVTALIAVNIITDLTLSVLIVSGTLNGDWEMPLFFAIVPTIAGVYCVRWLRSDRDTMAQSS